jgi:hypothetical protein
MQMKRPGDHQTSMRDFFSKVPRNVHVSPSRSDTSATTGTPVSQSDAAASSAPISESNTAGLAVSRGDPATSVVEIPAVALSDDDIARAILNPGGPCKLSDGVKHYLLITTVRPHGRPSSWPSETMPCGKVRRLTPFCFETYGWLTYSHHLAGLFCRICVFFAPENVGAAKSAAKQLVTEPCRRFSRLTGPNGFLYEHNKVHYHLSAKVAADNFRLRIHQPEFSVDNQLSSALEKKKTENRQIIRGIAEVILLCARMGLPLRGHRDDGQLPPPPSINDIVTDQGQFRTMVQLYTLGNETLARHLANNAANATYLSKTTQNELIESMATVIRRNVSKEVKSAEFFSVIADETTDISHRSQLSVSIRYVNNRKIVERFLEFVYPEALTGVALAEEIIGVLERAGLDLNKLVGQGYDGAAAMSGEFNGVQAIVKRRCGDQAAYVHCTAHAFNLTLVKASDIPEIRNTFGTVCSVATFINTSAVRTKALEEAIKEINDVSTKYRLKIPCQTRWVEKHEAIHTIWKLYPAICKVLADISQERNKASADASSLLASITKSDFIISLAVLNDVMSVTKTLAIVLQSASNDLISAVDHVAVLQHQLNAWRNDDDRFAKIFGKAEEVLGEPLTIPRIVGRQKNRNNIPASSAEEYFQRAVYLPFLDGILAQLDAYFAPHKAHALRLCGLLPKYAKDLDFNDIEASVEQYIGQLDGDIGDVELEFSTWKTFSTELCEPPHDCMSALDLCDHRFYPNIHKLLCIFATIPVSSATAERTFSVLKYLKSYLRSTMGEERLNGLALAYIHRDTNCTKVVDAIVALFATTQRKIPM